jgi:hypothetical protein
MSGYSFDGSSGKRYGYLLFPLPTDITKLPLQGGNFLFAAGSASDPVPIWIGSARSMRKTIQEFALSDHWHTATDIYGARFLYCNFDAAEDGQARLAQEIDLVDRYAPPMNRA